MSQADKLKKIAGVIRQRDAMEKALSVAERRQLTMLPKHVPEVPGYEFASTYTPCASVSGDFYDIIDLGDGKIGLLNGDVSGHGMEAGIIMGMAKKALQIYAHTGDSPVEVLASGNDNLCDDLDSETFFTVVYGVLDSKANKLEFVRAGHSHPILLGPTPDKWDVIKSGGMMIGMTGGPIFRKSLEAVTIDLMPGQSFYMYTDGIIEAHERGGALYGMDRLLGFLESAGDPRKPLQSVLDGLVVNLDEWTGGAEPEDDITVLAVRRNE